MTPLALLVGFLGAGKTTYLRNLLPALAEQGIEPHVIINDYQNARVDSELVRDLAESIVPISGSCVCCGSRDELVGALERFEHRPNRVMVVESNGTTDAEELVELLSLEPGLARFTPPLQVSCIDAKRWQKRFWHNALERDQTRTANYYFISRLDQVSESRAAEVAASFKQASGSAPERLAPEGFAERLRAIADEVGPLPDRSALAPSAVRESPACSVPHEHGHGRDGAQDHGHDHDHGAFHFASLQLDLPEQVERRALEEFLRGLPDGVLRAKGLVRFTDSPGEFHVFQKVDRFDDVQILPIGTESRIGRPLAVLIGPEIPESAIAADAARLFSVGEESAQSA